MRVTPLRAVLRGDLSVGSQVPGTHRRCRSDLPVLCKRPGVTGPTASGCVPPLQPEKRDGMTIVEDRRKDIRATLLDAFLNFQPTWDSVYGGHKPYYLPDTLPWVHDL